MDFGYIWDRRSEEEEIKITLEYEPEGRGGFKYQ